MFYPVLTLFDATEMHATEVYYSTCNSFHFYRQSAGTVGFIVPAYVLVCISTFSQHDEFFPRQIAIGRHLTISQANTNLMTCTH